MSKRNIAYVKPQEPAFLIRLKNQIGYKEGPTVETKKQKFENFSDSDDDTKDRDNEKPLVVVLKEGDLTAEEAAFEEARIAQEAAETPADLNQRIIFKKRKNDSNSKETLNTSSSSIAKISGNIKGALSSSTASSSKAEARATAATEYKEKSKKLSKKRINKSKLSFTNEEGEEEETE